MSLKDSMLELVTRSVQIALSVILIYHHSFAEVQVPFFARK